MFRNFIEHVGLMNCILLLVVISTIIVSEIFFLSEKKLDALFIGFWAPTILGFINYFKHKKWWILF